MRIFGLLVVATVAAFTMLGCFGSRSEGQLGHASFAWQECLLGCSVTDNPMAAGNAKAEISVSLANGYSFNTVRSSNEAVAQVALGGSNGLNVAVTSGSAGQTQLQLIDAHGKTVDQVTITVTETAKLSLTQGWTGSAPLVLEGSTQTFHVTTVDATRSSAPAPSASTSPIRCSTPTPSPSVTPSPSPVTPAPAPSPRAPPP